MSKHNPRLVDLIVQFINDIDYSKPIGSPLVIYHVRSPSLTSYTANDTLLARHTGLRPVVLDWEESGLARRGIGKHVFERLDPLRAADEAEWRTAAADGLAILSRARSLGVHNVGIYGLPLTNTHYNRIRRDDSHAEWVAAMDALAATGLIDAQDTLYPSLYLPDAWRERWSTFRVPASVVLDHVVAWCESHGKSCIPFIRMDNWPDPVHAAEWESMVRERAGDVFVWSPPIQGDN